MNHWWIVAGDTLSDGDTQIKINAFVITRETGTLCAVIEVTTAKGLLCATMAWDKILIRWPWVQHKIKPGR